MKPFALHTFAFFISGNTSLNIWKNIYAERFDNFSEYITSENYQITNQ